MIAVAVPLAVALATVLPVTRPANVDALVAQYGSQCAGAAAPNDACRRMKVAIEYSLYTDLRALSSAGAELDRDVLRVAAAADCPQLRAFALERLGLSLQRSEDALVIDALDSPFPRVREAALRAASGLPEPRWAQLQRREDRTVDTSVGGLLPGTPPDPKTLGAPLPAGARYRFLASGPKRAFYTTKDAPEAVVAALAAGGRHPVLTAEQLQQKQKAAKKQPDPAAMMALMQKYQGDMAKMMAEMGVPGELAKVDWSDGFEHDDTVVAPKYVVLETASFGGAEMPAKVAIVFRDTLFGETAIVFPLAAEEAKHQAALGAAQMKVDPETMQRRMRIMQMEAIEQ